jgi:PBP1b-binding outer membrane lipoprotein LpoB
MKRIAAGLTCLLLALVVTGCSNEPDSCHKAAEALVDSNNSGLSEAAQEAKERLYVSYQEQCDAERASED